MTRFYLLLLLCVAAYGDDASDDLARFNDLFQDPGLEKKQSCSGIHGDLPSGCHDCYPCDDERLKIYKVKTEKLKLVHRSCDTTTTVCCVPQQYFVVKAQGTSCGMQMNARRGYRHDERASVRSVLAGEYPWRAWVYRKGGSSASDILCAATVIDDNVDVVMTSASCVDGLHASRLAVSFSRTLGEAVHVASVTMHENYTSRRPHVDDIALLRLDKAKEAPPSWAAPVCLPGAAAMHATTCITMSSTDCFINTVIPLEKKCREHRVLVEKGQMCAVTPAGDYEPERGAALTCRDPLHTEESNYFVYGIALTSGGSVTTYTDVYKYLKWIEDILT